MKAPIQSILTLADLQAIGLVTTNWAYLEGSAEQLVWTLLGVDTIRGRSITTHVPFTLRLDMLRTLLRVTFFHYEPEIVVLKRLVNRIKWIAPKRNKIVHGEWAKVIGSRYTLSTYTFTARGRLKPTGERLTTRHIERIGVIIENIVNDLDSFADHCKRRIETMPQPWERLAEIEARLREQGL